MSVGGGYPAIDMTVEAMTCQKRGVAWLYSRDANDAGDCVTGGVGLCWWS